MRHRLRSPVGRRSPTTGPPLSARSPVGTRPSPGARRRAAGLACAAALLLLAACGNPAGVDGTLADDWAPIAAPTGFTPQAGTCHAADFADVGTRDAYEQVDCDTQHRTETVYVGTYPSAPAEGTDPPASGSASARAAYRECDLKTTAYVGAAWRTARLWIGVVQPSPGAWRGGARWFRCDVLEVSSIEDDGGLVQRTGSLRNALREADSPLRLSCYAIQLDAKGEIDTMPAARCTARHNAEFVGVWSAGDLPYPKQGGQWETFHDGCRRVIAKYVGVPVDGNLEFRTGVVSLPGGQDVWTAGDHAVRCYLWLDGAKLTTSLKGRGAKALPIQYE